MPPDILNEPDANGSNLDESVTNEGGQIQLLCLATGVPQPTVSILQLTFFSKKFFFLWKLCLLFSRSLEKVSSVVVAFNVLLYYYEIWSDLYFIYYSYKTHPLWRRNTFTKNPCSVPTCAVYDILPKFWGTKFSILMKIINA